MYLVTRSLTKIYIMVGLDPALYPYRIKLVAFFKLPKLFACFVLERLTERPVITTILLGVFAYFAGLLFFVLLMQMDYRMLLIGTTAGAIPIVLFHWFISRFERKSSLAQVIAIVPAIGFVGLAFVFAQGIVASQICYLDADSRNLVCHFD